MVAVPDPPKLRRRATRFFTTNGLPTGFEWVEKLSSLHYRLFIIELRDALANAVIRKEDGDTLAAVLEDWEATAEVDANPELAHKLKSPRSEKQYRDWTPPSHRP